MVRRSALEEAGHEHAGAAHDRRLPAAEGGDRSPVLPAAFGRLRAALPPPDVEDVLQETFLAVWKGATGYRPRGTPQAWMWVIARNQAALLLRRRGPVTAPLAATPYAGLDPAEAALVRADTAAALSGPEGEVLRLMYVEDRPVAEIAALLGVPAGTVKSRAHRARRRLRGALAGAR